MLFKFIEKPIEITCFVPSSYSFAVSYSPIVRASKIIPEWWKKIQKSTENLSTVKSCPGITNIFQTGFLMPIWCDLDIKTNFDGSWKYQFSDEMSKLFSHSNNQASNFYSDHFFLKLESPWSIQTSKDLKLVCCDPFYHSMDKKPYYTPYGILPTIKKMANLNMFLFFEKKINDVLIQQGTPILHIIPLTEKPIILKNEIVSDEEWRKRDKILNGRISFFNNGLNKMKILRKQKNG